MGSYQGVALQTLPEQRNFNFLDNSDIINEDMSVLLKSEKHTSSKQR